MPGVKQLLPKVLAQLARESGGASQLAPVWEEVAGPAIARAAAPVSLADGTLELRVSQKAWAAELASREAELLDRLSARLGPSAVRRLSFRVE